MKKLHKLAAATAIALSLGGLSPYASAIGFVPHGMTVSSDLRGDTLLFPVFYGRGENFYTISNNSGSWVQGHLRFRGAAWSGELLDMDIILSPGDVFVFRLADIDGDGHWELDQSLDPLNFRYSGMLSNCGPGPYLPSETTPPSTAVVKQNCMDPKFKLVPLPKVDNGVNGGGITAERIDYHVHNGYIEFIGEGVFDNMDHGVMGQMIDPINASKLAAFGQRKVGNGLGTSLWSWVVGNSPNTDALATYNAVFPNTNVVRTASDVTNGLGGTAFVTLVPGQDVGFSYNAESIVDFRTVRHQHRVDNYTPEPSVILHTEDASANPSNFTYVYFYKEETKATQWGSNIGTSNQEGRISFNNTWGPTLADGDDYDVGNPEISVLSRLRAVQPDGRDSWDVRFARGVNSAIVAPNSIAEVEEAFRKARLRSDEAGDFVNLSHLLTPGDGTQASWGVPFSGQLTPTSSGQLFTGFYFDRSVFDKACSGNGRTPTATCSNSQLQTWYFAYAPTKFFYGEDDRYWIPPVVGTADIRANMIDKLLGKRGYLQGAVEQVLAIPKSFSVELWDINENTTSGCTTSPCVTDPNFPVYEELSVFSIANVKDKLSAEGAFGNLASWDMGRLLLGVSDADNTCTSTTIPLGNDLCERTFPVVIYGFDMNLTTASVNNWRAMHR